MLVSDGLKRYVQNEHQPNVSFNLSWEDAVKNALEHYQVVYERYKGGQCKTYRKPAEYFLKASGELMENLGDLLELRDHLFEHIRDKKANNRK